MTEAPANTTYTDNAIGKSNWSTDPYFDGSLADIAVYPTVLSASRILTHYADGTAPVDNLTTYAYNGDGLRMSKTGVATTESYTYNQTTGTPQMIVDGSIDYVYGADGLPLEQVSSSDGVLWIHHDALGSTRTITDDTGAVVGTATYSPYGQTTATTGVTTPFGYAGAYTDPETGYLYLVHRYYDPATGVFLSVDPLIAVTAQPYAYTANDPLNATDPNGEDWSAWMRLGAGFMTWCAAMCGVHSERVPDPQTPPAEERAEQPDVTDNGSCSDLTDENGPSPEGDTADPVTYDDTWNFTTSTGTSSNGANAGAVETSSSQTSSSAASGEGQALAEEQAEMDQEGMGQAFGEAMNLEDGPGAADG